MEEGGRRGTELFVVREGEGGQRLDRFLGGRIEGMSRAGLQRLIAAGLARLNGEDVKAHHRVRAGDRVELSIPPPREADVRPEEIPLDVLFEDDDIIVINKRPGMIVHPAGRIVSGTLVNALLARCRDLSGVGGALKPGIVHRLDRGTSGCLVAAKNDEAHLALSDQFARRKVRKEYLALVHGSPESDSGKLTGPIGRHPVRRRKMTVRPAGGRDAETAYEVIERFEGVTFVRLFPKTGRTHQIRVHMAHSGHPLLGDAVYGGGRERRFAGPKAPRPMLHAWRLSFAHPRTGEALRFEAPLPEDFTAMLGSLGWRGEAGRPRP